MRSFSSSAVSVPGVVGVRRVAGALSAVVALIAIVFGVVTAAADPDTTTAAPPTLTDQQVDAAMAGIPGWTHVGTTLRRSVEFPTFMDGIDAVERVGEYADKKNHHPDIDIRWRTVTFTLSTHSAGGITNQDIAMANDINTIVSGGQGH